MRGPVHANTYAAVTTAMRPPNDFNVGPFDASLTAVELQM